MWATVDRHPPLDVRDAAHLSLAATPRKITYNMDYPGPRRMFGPFRRLHPDPSPISSHFAVDWRHVAAMRQIMEEAIVAEYGEEPPIVKFDALRAKRWIAAPVAGSSDDEHPSGDVSAWYLEVRCVGVRSRMFW